MMEKGESQKGPYNIVAWHRMFFHCLGASTKNMRILQAQKMLQERTGYLNKI